VVSGIGEEPARPVPSPANFRGISIRDHMALELAKAMIIGVGQNIAPVHEQAIPRAAYRMADEMMKARK